MAGGFRPDIDGLRALAVAAVVLFHLGVPGFSAGYVGVDVFFVLSGFLILRQLAHALVVDGRLALVDFWARRARRLLPAAFVVTTGAALASAVFLPVRLAATADQLLAQAVYAGNVHFLLEGRSYFEESTPRLLLHTWSLAVEEQFCVAIPLLLALLALVARAIGRRVSATAVIASLTLLGVASLVGAARVEDPDVVFHASPLRAWEFIAGGLIAVVGRGPQDRRIATLVAAVGLVAVVVAVLGRGPGLAFPWPGAIVPVAGTGLVLLAHGAGASTPIFRALSTSPMQWLGRRSYALYLVHWPLWLFVGVAVGPTDHTMLVPVVSLLTSVLAAMALHRLIEEPLRFHPALASSSARSLGLALALSLATVGAAAFLRHRAAHDVEALAIHEAGRSVVDTRGRCATLVVPTLLRECVWGDPDADFTVLLIGDSHAMMWIAPLKDAGLRDHVRVVYAGMSACPAFDVDVADAPGHCRRWRHGLPGLVRRLRPDAVIVAHANRYVSPRYIDGDAATAWFEGAVALREALAPLGVPLGLIHDVPPLAQNVLECAAFRSASSCGPTPAGVAHALFVQALEEEALAPAATYNPLHERAFCPRPAREAPVPTPALSCRARDGARLLYRDADHLSREGARAHTAGIRALLASLRQGR